VSLFGFCSFSRLLDCFTGLGSNRYKKQERKKQKILLQKTVVSDIKKNKPKKTPKMTRLAPVIPMTARVVA